MCGIGVVMWTSIFLGSVTVYVVAGGGWHLCGHQLSDTLELVCQGRGYHVSKKDLRPTDYSEPGKDMEEHHYRMRRSIVEECCKDMCSISKLESYCAPGPSHGSNLRLRPTGSPSAPRRRPGRPSNQSPSKGKVNVGQGPSLPDTFFWVTPARRDPFAKYIHSHRQRSSSKERAKQ